jgi:hypothetical protein
MVFNSSVMDLAYLKTLDKGGSDWKMTMTNTSAYFSSGIDYDQLGLYNNTFTAVINFVS